MARIYKSVSAGQSSSNSGGGEVTKYALAFNNTSDWSGPSGGYYTLYIPATTHGKGINPAAVIFENITGDFYQVDVDSVEFDAAGNITITVTEDGDDRFTGKVLIF